MKKAAATIALATFLSAPMALAEDKLEGPTQLAAADTNTSGEIVLENAAVNRAFGNGEVAIPDGVAKPHRWGVYLGIRAMNIKDPGFDPYSEADALVQNALGVTFSPWRSGAWSLHIGAEWNLGAQSAYARGAQTNLLVNRLALGLEGRWMPKSRFYLYAKVVPAATNFFAQIDDYSLGANLESSSWAMLLDTSAGAALRLGTAGKAPKRTVSFWLMMDWGYTFAGSATMSFLPANIEDDTRTFGAVNLPSLKASGFVTRATFGLTF